MARKKTAKAEVIKCDPSRRNGKLKVIGGSMSDDWNNVVANQAVKALWHRSNADSDEIRVQQHATIEALVGMAPRDEFEGMIAAQLIAAHNAAMECYRRAMLPEQPFESWREQLNQASKLSRTHASLLEALNRHRGKGQQKVTVEHVHVHEGGQAIVGNVGTTGGGIPVKSEDQPHAKQVAYAPGIPMPGADTTRDAVPITCDEERPLQDARWPVQGNRNAYKHGRYTAEAIACRREISALIRAARDLARG